MNATTIADLATLIGNAYIRAHSVRRAVGTVSCETAENEIDSAFFRLEGAQIQIENGWTRPRATEDTLFQISLATLHIDRAVEALRRSGDHILSAFAERNFERATAE